MAIEDFAPKSGELQREDLGIVLLNHFGSKIRRDTGGDAQFLADQLGVGVLAADRPPCPAVPDAIHHQQQVADLYVLSMKGLAAEIDNRARELGWRTTIAVGRSAGGLGAMALALTEGVSSLRYVGAVEPPACETLTIRDGATRFRDYKRREKFYRQQAQRDRADPDRPGRYTNVVLPKPPQLSLAGRLIRLAHMGPDAWADRQANKYLWASNAAIHYAKKLAAEHPGIDTTIEFAEFSMTNNDIVWRSLQQAQSERAQMPQVVAAAGGHVAPFVVSTSVDTIHASYDNRKYMGRHFVRPILKRALDELS